MYQHNITPKDSLLKRQSKYTNYSVLKPVFQIAESGIKLIEQIRDSKSKELFTVKPANAWMEDAKNRPVPKKLFDEFWYEGEVCIFFADTNLGKSILAVQIGDSISKGVPIPGFKLGALKQKVLYYDFELSDKQFQNRYTSGYEQPYRFDDNFLRVEINPDAILPEIGSYEEFLICQLERSILQSGAKILIVDNLTYLKNETEKAKDALPLMKHLKSLKNKYDLSILALAHTPKRDLSKPITRNDLQGSKMLMNFIDSSFTIGESQKGKNIRYIKQIKARQNEFVYDTENVCVCRIDKEFNFLQFHFFEFGSEREHLKEIPIKDFEGKKAEALELKKEGHSNVEIGRRLEVSEGAVRKWFKQVDGDTN